MPASLDRHLHLCVAASCATHLKRLGTFVASGFVSMLIGFVPLSYDKHDDPGTACSVSHTGLVLAISFTAFGFMLCFSLLIALPSTIIISSSSMRQLLCRHLLPGCVPPSSSAPGLRPDIPSLNLNQVTLRLDSLCKLQMLSCSPDPLCSTQRQETTHRVNRCTCHHRRIHSRQHRCSSIPLDSLRATSRCG